MSSPIPVAMEYPKTPVSKAGSTRVFQFLLVAIAAAVVGPPTLALEARAISLKGKLRILPARQEKTK